MLSINIKEGNFGINDVEEHQLEHILNLYNKIEEFKYATGIFKPIDLCDLKLKYTDISFNDNEFFVSIYLGINNTIGIVKGSINNKKRDVVWINTLAIDTAFQKMGYGTRALGLLINFFKLKFNCNRVYLSVDQNNIKGLNFWLKQSFKPYRSITKKKKSDENILVLYRNI